MRHEDFAELLKEIQQEELEVREEGQKEYARDESNAFSNFEWIADLLSRGREHPITREDVLLVYALKHLDGIMSHVNGHKSQREDVRGRIKDLRMYLALLRGMIDENGEGADLGLGTADGFWQDGTDSAPDYLDEPAGEYSKTRRV